MQQHPLTPTLQSVNLPDGRTLTLETGVLARQADGSVLVRQGNAMLLATVVSRPASEPKAFLPLSVDYQERFAAAGRIPGSFHRREGRLGQHEILISRLVDRAIRPCFPKGFHDEVQVNLLLISLDEAVACDTLAALGASAALMLAPNIPFYEPISEVRVARQQGQWLINPSPQQQAQAELDLIVAAAQDRILMIEGQMDEVSEAELVEAIKQGQQAIQVQCAAQQALAAACGVQKAPYQAPQQADQVLMQTLFDAFYQPCYEVAAQALQPKSNRAEAFKAIKQSYLDSLPEDHAIAAHLIDAQFAAAKRQAVRDLIVKEGKRLDGRSCTQVRPIHTQVDLLPGAHGSALFTRGQTQCLATVTLGSRLDEKVIDTAAYRGYDSFMLDYNFPGFCTGDVKPNRGPSRREIGHARLARRAIARFLPEENPYTIRVVADILESDGSSSMATTCASSLALMDAGIAMRKAVSGIAMGLIATEDGKYHFLSDICGQEDQCSDMDFKVTGTSEGITACQMDIKVAGLTYQAIQQALLQAKAGREHILTQMQQALSAPRAEPKKAAPCIINVPVASSKISAVIGPKGKMVQQLQQATGATIQVTDENGEGNVNIFAPDKASLQQALEHIRLIVTDPEVGKTYSGKVKTITSFGAFVEFLPGKDGLLHISEVSEQRLESLEGVLEVGQDVEVKLVNIHPKTGKFSLSIKRIAQKEEAPTTEQS